MKLLVLARTLREQIVGLARDQRGASALEFAIALPFLFMFYMGGVEVSQEVANDRKVSMVARAVADLASRTNTIDDSDMTSIFAAASAVIAPFASSGLQVKLSSVSIDSVGKATIVWSNSLNTTARTRGSTVTVPAALNISGTTLLWGEVVYPYKPTIGAVLTGTFNLSDQIYMRPRVSNCVTRTGSSPTVC